MKTSLVCSFTVFLFFSGFSQEAGLQFDTGMLRPSNSGQYTPQWKNDRLANPAFDYFLYKLTHVNIPAAYSFATLSLFCKMEVKMEQTAHFPVKFRLGSVQYVDWLEQKRFSSY